MATPAPAPRLPLPAIIGPTCSGKSALAQELAASLPVAIVNVDAALVYRGLDIGSAKPSAADRASAPHYMLDLVNPDEEYSAWRFCGDVREALAEIDDRGLCPLLVGGSMFYFLALATGMAGAQASAEARRQVKEMARGKSSAELHASLARADADAAEAIHANDRFRVLRAWERQLAPASSQIRQEPLPLRGFFLAPINRRALDGPIARRLEGFFAQGLIDETAQLRQRWALDASSPSMRLVGYRQALAHLAGECSLERAIARARRATELLCKRQYTWMRSGRISAEWHSEPAELAARLRTAIEGYLAQRRR